MQKTAFLYMRASSSKQDMSVRQQQDVCRKYARENSILIVDEFEDDGKSAYQEGVERKGFNSLLDACKGRKVDYVLLWNIDRFSRQYKVGMIELLSLELTGVKLMDTVYGLYQSDDLGGAIKQVVGIFGAHQYSKNISENVKRGLAQRKEDGFCHGEPPTGYMIRRVDGGATWVPNPDETETIRYIFTMFDSGMTYQAIARVLNQEGYMTKRAKYFQPPTIRQFLRNPSFGGYRGKYGDIRKHRITTFLDRELWERCYHSAHNVRLNKNKSGTRRKNVLTGLVRCGKCGDLAHIVAGPSKHSRYRCRGVRGEVCDARYTVSMKTLEWAVIRQVQDCIVEEGIETLVDRIIKEQFEKDTAKQKSVQPLLDRLEELDVAERRLHGLAVAGGSTTLLGAELSRISEERQTVQDEIEAHGMEVQPIPRSEAHRMLMDRLKGFNDNLRDVLPNINSIVITGPNEVVVEMYGREIELDLNQFTKQDKPAKYRVPANWALNCQLDEAG